MPAWTFRRAKSLDLCGLQRAGTGQVISYPSETQKCCSIVPRDIEKAGKRFLTSYPLSVTACLPAVKLVCFQTFLIGGCPKDTGFFFLPVSVATDLISSDRCSEMDIVLDLWVSAIYNDNQVQGSDLGPVVYFRNGTGNPLVTYTELAARWGLSRATVGRVLKKLAALDYISLMSFPGRHGSVIYLQKYLSTMFEISDVMVDKEEVAMTLNIRLELPKEDSAGHDAPALEHEVIVSDELASVSKSHIEIILQKMAQILMAQGISCFGCPLSRYKLYPLSGDCREDLLPRAREQSLMRFGLAVLCGNKQVATFELTLSPSVEN